MGDTRELKYHYCGMPLEREYAGRRGDYAIYNFYVAPNGADRVTDCPACGMPVTFDNINSYKPKHSNIEDLICSLIDSYGSDRFRLFDAHMSKLTRLPHATKNFIIGPARPHRLQISMNTNLSPLVARIPGVDHIRGIYKQAAVGTALWYVYIDPRYVYDDVRSAITELLTIAYQHAQSAWDKIQHALIDCGFEEEPAEIEAK
jgi:hypothetical protein